MAVINLTDCLPEGKDGSKGFLPKQSLFFSLAMDPNGPKFIRYCGGIGSGKSVIGCMTVLAWALQYPGDYLIGRQFFPELRDTTLKTFLELCPKELIVEYRVADSIVRVKSSGGQVSNVFFRHLEEPDKHRSMNLNGFYIDESSQTSEVAFLLLQGRLRGKYVRKGIMTTNSAGHDFGWRYFVKQDMFKSEEAKRQFYNIKAPSTENVHLPDGYVSTMLETWSEDRVRREIMADEDSFEGAIFSEFRRDLHVVKPFRIPDEWTKLVGCDHGFKNPAAWIWGAVDYNGDIYIYREFYESGWLIEEIVRGFNREGVIKPGVLKMMTGPDGQLEKIDAAYIDPSTRAVKGQTGSSDWDYYIDYLPKTFPLMLAKNDVAPGIDRIKTYLKPSPTTGKPSLYIFDSCKNLIEEMTNYQYEELPVGQVGKKNEKESPKKVNDHACFSADTLVLTERGEVPISEITPKDCVMTRHGLRPVMAAGITGIRETHRYLLSSGRELVATPDHPVYSSGEFIPIGEAKWLHRVESFSTINGSLLPLTGTTVRTPGTAETVFRHCTGKFGRSLKALFQMDTTSTIKMATALTTTLRTWSVFPPPRTCPTTRALPSGYSLVEPKNTWSQCATSLPSGINRKKEESGTENTLVRLLKKLSPLKSESLLVSTAENPSSLLKPLRTLNFVGLTARLMRAEGLAWTTRRVLARAVDSFFLLIGIEKPVRVLRSAPHKCEEVYNLSVEDCPEFFANGVLVHNCDALRYLVVSRPEAPKPEDNRKKLMEMQTLEGSLLRELDEVRNPKYKQDMWRDY